MAAQEEEHLATFEEMAIEWGVRPTVGSPVWDVLGYTLGFSTAAIGPEAAMACTGSF